MRILRVEAQNFKPFKNLSIPEDPDAEIPEGLILIKGQNSMGKSSLFEAILWGLWGPDAILPKNEDLINFSSTFCKVIIIFEIEGTRYKIERSFDSASKMRAIMYYMTSGEWQRIAHRASEVKKKIEEILNIDYKQALNTLLVRQGEVAKIADARPSELRNILVDVYNLEIIQNMKKQLEFLEKDLALRIRTLNDQYESPESINENIAKIKAKIKEQKKTAKNLEKEVKQYSKKLKELPELEDISRLEDAMREIERVEDRLEQAEEDRNTYLTEAGLAVANEKVIQKRLTNLQKQRKKLDEENKRLQEEMKSIDEKMGGIKSTRRDLKEKIKHLKQIEVSAEHAAKCPTCSKPLTIEERDAIIQEYQKTIETGKIREEELLTERKGHWEKLRENENAIREFDDAIRALERVIPKQQTVVKLEKELQEKRETLATLIKSFGVSTVDELLAKYKVSALRELESEITQLVTNLNNQKRRLSDIRQEIEENQKWIKELEDKIVRMETLKAQVTELEKLSNHTNYLRLKLVSGFIADYVIQKRLIGIIRAATNQYVTAFTNGQYTSIDLEAITSGQSMGLVLRVRDERDDATKSTSQLSFGDRTAVSLALRLGVSRTMSSIRPLRASPAVSPRVKCVMLDEPLAGLDAERRKSVVQSLINDISFSQIFLITHTDVQDWEGVSVIDIRKSGNYSTATLRTSGPE